MEDPPPAADLLWENQQRAYKAQADIERRVWLKSFTLVLALILLTLAGAAGLAALARTP
jgi:hypothetical protein